MTKREWFGKGHPTESTTSELGIECQPVLSESPQWFCAAAHVLLVGMCLCGDAIQKWRVQCVSKIPYSVMGATIFVTKEKFITSSSIYVVLLENCNFFYYFILESYA